MSATKSETKAADGTAPDTADEAKAGAAPIEQVAGASRNDHDLSAPSRMGSERLTSQGLSDPTDALRRAIRRHEDGLRDLLIEALTKRTLEEAAAHADLLRALVNEQRAAASYLVRVAAEWGMHFSDAEPDALPALLVALHNLRAEQYMAAAFEALTVRCEDCAVAAWACYRCESCAGIWAAIQSALDERGRSEYERGRSDEQDSREEITEARNRAGR